MWRLSEFPVENSHAPPARTHASEFQNTVNNSNVPHSATHDRHASCEKSGNSWKRWEGNSGNSRALRQQLPAMSPSENPQGCLDSLGSRGGVRYKEEFEKNKGKGFSVVSDTPELQRMRKTQDQISNIKYHEDFEKSRMGGSLEGGEERRNSQDGAIFRRPLEPQHPSQPSTSGKWGWANQGPQRDSGIQNVSFAEQNVRYRAVYDYAAADEDEISFLDGDVILNVQVIDEGWMYGTVERTGDTGMLPANYVETV
ncbi:UNVERIFIED_CONTAM: hypothetical protein FKN15_076087 [Acipenser sinensis]